MKKVKGSDFFCGELFPESTSVEKTEALPNSYDWGDLFERLSQSRFRSKFRLTTKEIVYLKEKGVELKPMKFISLILSRNENKSITRENKTAVIQHFLKYIRWEQYLKSF